MVNPAACIRVVITVTCLQPVYAHRTSGEEATAPYRSRIMSAGIVSENGDASLILQQHPLKRSEASGS